MRRVGNVSGKKCSCSCLDARSRVVIRRISDKSVESGVKYRDSLQFDDEILVLQDRCAPVGTIDDKCIARMEK